MGEWVGRGGGGGFRVGVRHGRPTFDSAMINER